MASIIDNPDPFGDGSLVAKYLLDGSADDLLGNYNGTPENVSYATGKFGQGVVSNGSSTQITIDIYDELAPKIFTFSWWLKTTIKGSNSGYDGSQHFLGVDSPGAGSGDFSFKLDENGYPMMFCGLHSGEDISIKNEFDITDDTWHHVVFVVDAGTSNISIYCDNIAVHHTLTLDAELEEDPIRLCRDTYSTFNGMVDQVEIYNRALTEEEVGYLYTQNIPSASGGLYLGDNQADKVYLGDTEVTTMFLGDIQVGQPDDTLYTDDPDPFGDGSLTAKYLLDGNGDDLLGNYNCDIHGTPEFMTGRFGECAYVNDSNYLTADNAGMPSNSDDPYTVSFWVKGGEGDDDFLHRSGISDGSTYCTFTIGRRNGKLFTSAFGGSGTNHNGDIDISDLNTWYHIVCCFHGSVPEVRKYVNSVRDTTATAHEGSCNNTPKLKIGNNDSNSIYMDQVEIFNKILSDEEVTALYNQQERN